MNKFQSCAWAAVAAVIATVPLAKGGSVSAYISGGDLVVCGSSAADCIEIHQVDSVTWSVGAMGPATRVNDGPYAILSPVTCGINIDLKGGNDKLIVRNGTVPKALCILLGTGNDAASLTNLTIGGLQINPENSQTIAAVETASPSSSGGYLRLKGDDGNDSILVNNVVVLNNAILAGSADPDLLSKVAATVSGSYSSSKWSTVAGCNGNDQIVIQNFQVKKLEVTGGRGSDDVTVQVGSLPSLGCERMCVDTGSDTDTCRLTLAFSSDVAVEVGPGKSDRLTVVGCSADSAEFSDCGTNGFIDGTTNFFNWMSVDSNFTHRTGYFY